MSKKPAQYSPTKDRRVGEGRAPVIDKAAATAAANAIAAIRGGQISQSEPLSDDADDADDADADADVHIAADAVESDTTPVAVDAASTN